MSAFKKRNKSMKRTHRERDQLSSRRHLGLLEKHKDYVLRARNYEKKKRSLKLLHEKARNKNPDEFYYRMINEKLQDGRHVIPQKEETYTPEQQQVMQTQDIKYVEMKQTVEEKKIERLRSSLHLLSDAPSNSHTIFVDSEEEVATFDAAKYFNTVPELVPRAFNRATKQQLVSGTVPTETPQDLESVTRQSGRQYRELGQRIRRQRELKSLVQKMKTEKLLSGKGQKWKVPGGSGPRTYKWKMERKR